MFIMIAYSVVSGLVGVLAFFGNLTVLLVVALNKEFYLMRYFYLISLACSDFLFAILVLSFRVVSTAHEEWIFGVRWCYISAYMAEAFYFIAVLHLCAVSYDRYLAIVKEHLTYNCFITPKKVIIAVSILWIMPLAIAAGRYFGYEAHEYHTKVFACILKIDRRGTLVTVFLGFLTPLVLVCVLNYKVLKVARRVKCQISVQCANETSPATAQESVEIQRGRSGSAQATSVNSLKPPIPSYENDSPGVGEAPKAPTEEVCHCSSQPEDIDGMTGSQQEGTTDYSQTYYHLEAKQPSSDQQESDTDVGQESNRAITFEIKRCRPRVAPAKLQPHVGEGGGSREHLDDSEIRGSSSTFQRLYRETAWEENPVESRGKVRCMKQFVKTLKEFKAAWDVMFIIGAFMLSYLPQCIAALSTALGKEPSSTVLLAVHSVFATSAVWNPVIYSIRKKEFRRAARKMLKLWH